MSTSTDTEGFPYHDQEGLALLKDFLTDLAVEVDAEDGTTSAVVDQWRSGALHSLSHFQPDSEDEEVPEATNGYKVFTIEASHGKRTYRAEISLDNDFDAASEAKLRRALDLMITRMVNGQLRNFIRRAEPGRNGLRNRRSRRLDFPRPLPYLDPRPTTIEAQVAEEAGIVEAAVFTAFNAQTSAPPRESENCGVPKDQYHGLG